jgi:hypothetical protein
LFGRRPELRQLRLAIDSANLPASPELEVLLELCRLPQIDATATTDCPGLGLLLVDGCPDDAHVIDLRILGPGGRVTFTGRYDAVCRRADAERWAERSGEPVEESMHRFQLAGALSGTVDGLVLRETRLPPWGDPNVLTVRQALALLGLYLRYQDEPQLEVWPGGSGLRMPTVIQQRRLVSELLPALSAWSQVVRSLGGSPNGALQRVARGATTRLERILYARDQVMSESLIRSDRTSQATILYHLDAMLLWLGGTFDVLALVADRAVGLSTDKRDVSWRYPDWRKSIAKKAPALAELVGEGEWIRSVIDLTAEMRNTIHGSPLHVLRYSARQYDNVDLVELPVDVAAAVDRAIGRLGGALGWGGVEGTRVDRGSIWDPFVFAQVLTPMAFGAVASLMAATVEAWGGEAEPVPNGPAPARGMLDARLIPRVRLLHGL